MKRILAIETSGELCGVALIQNGKVVAEKNILLPKNSSSKIFDIIENVTKKDSKLDAVAVDIGPGSFTGTRIGVSLARAYGQFLKLPVIGISSLDCMVFNALKQKNIKGMIFPVIDALRCEVYTAGYEGQRRISEYRIISIDKLTKMSDKKTVVVCGKKIFKKNPVGRCIAVDITASAVGLLAWDKLSKNKKYSYDRVLPLYLRRAFAEDRNERAK